MSLLFAVTFRFIRGKRITQVADKIAQLFRKVVIAHFVEVITSLLIGHDHEALHFFNGTCAGHLTTEFPHLVSYARFVALMPGMLVSLLASLQSRFGPCTGISFIDSTSLQVCNPTWIRRHRVFATDARRGKTSMGWFFGFKLHL